MSGHPSFAGYNYIPSKGKRSAGRGQFLAHVPAAPGFVPKPKQKLLSHTPELTEHDQRTIDGLKRDIKKCEEHERKRELGMTIRCCLHYR